MQSGEVYIKVLRSIPGKLPYGTSMDAMMIRIAEALAPAATDWCAFGLVESGVYRPVVMHHVDPARVGVFRRMRAAFPAERSGGKGPGGMLDATEGRLFPAISAADLALEAKSQAHYEVLAGFQLRSMVAVPLLAYGRSVGCFTMTTGDSGRDHGDDALIFGEALAHRFTCLLEGADAAESVRRDFLQMINHELRSPLTPLMGYLDLLCTQGYVDFPPQFLDSMQRSADRLLRRVDALVSYTADVGTAKLWQVLEPEVLVKGLRDSFTRAVNLQGKRLTLVCSLTHKTSVLMPVAIAHRILTELLDNALKFTDEAEVHLDLEIAGPYFEARVSDQGAGIRDEERTSIFMPFFRGSAGRQERDIEGLGLGLALAVKLAVEAGGELTLKEPRHGEGAVFQLRLPAAPAPLAPMH